MATEKRLIDANGYDAILKNREETLIAYSGSLSGAIKGCRALLDEQPIVDAVEVVRCKDCRYCMSDVHGLWCFNDYENNLQPDDFCSRGERKDNACND